MPEDDAALARRLEAVAGDPGLRPLLVALDFDGTLAPLQDDPARSAIPEDGVAVLKRLAAVPLVTLALVSGRSMADLHTLASVPVGTVLIGSHGAERARLTTFGLDRDVVRLTDEQADVLAALGARAAAVARGRDGVWVESKPTAVVVHSRLAPRDVAAQARDEALALGASSGVDVMEGKDVVELSVLHADKGAALTALRDELGAALVLYAGDDVTDERAFGALGDDDVTVKVGDGDSSAAYRVHGPEELVGVLTAFADALHA